MNDAKAFFLLIAFLILMVSAVQIFASTTGFEKSPFPVEQKEEAPPREAVMSLQYLRVEEARLVNVMTYKALLDKIIFYCKSQGQVDLDFNLDGIHDTRLLCTVHTREGIQ